jgi:hypothetical protein
MTGWEFVGYLALGLGSAVVASTIVFIMATWQPRKRH